jgi:hypothetical protein
MRSFRISGALLLAATLAISLQGQIDPNDDVTDPLAVTFSQVSFVFPSPQSFNSQTGMIFVDYQRLASLGFVDGFLQVIECQSQSSTCDWIVQNLPIIGLSGIPATSQFFLFPSNTGQRNDFNVFVLATKPPPRRGGGPPPPPANMMPNTNGHMQQHRPIQRINGAIGGISGIQLPMRQNGAQVMPIDPQNPNQAGTTLPNSSAVQEDVNQCAPGSVNNSMQYLSDRYGVPVDMTLGTDNRPGMNRGPRDGGPTPPQSRVAQIDARMGRTAGNTTPVRNVLDGKMAFLRDAGIANRLVVRSQGVFCGPGNNNCVNGSNGARPTAAFIQSELDAGEDMEICFSTATFAHCVRVTGYSFQNGFMRLNYVQDFAQGNNNVGTAANEGGVGTFTVGQVATMPNGTALIITSNMITVPAGTANPFTGGGIITNVITESPAP